MDKVPRNHALYRRGSPVASGLVPLARRPLAGECLVNRHRFAKRLTDLKTAGRLEYGEAADPAYWHSVSTIPAG